jgi:hypothetical protein
MSLFLRNKFIVVHALMLGFLTFGPAANLTLQNLNCRL